MCVSVYLHWLDICIDIVAWRFFGKPLFVGTRSNSTHFAIDRPTTHCVKMGFVHSVWAECAGSRKQLLPKIYRAIFSLHFSALQLLSGGNLFSLFSFFFFVRYYYTIRVWWTVCRCLFLCILLLPFWCVFVCLCIFIADRCAHSITFLTQQMNSRNGKKTHGVMNLIVK